MQEKEKFIIQGLGGEKTLHGEIAVNGAKNDVLKAMASSLLFADELKITCHQYSVVSIFPIKSTDARSQ
jgi:UDP-N-acetylglucosamine enolpyruvyl transferase